MINRKYCYALVAKVAIINYDFSCEITFTAAEIKLEKEMFENAKAFLQKLL